jgi:type IV secretory pathway VirD2 relaxase
MKKVSNTEKYSKNLTREQWKDWQQDIALVKALQASHSVTFNTYQLLNKSAVTALVDQFEQRINRLLDKKLGTHGTKLEWLHFFQTEKTNAHMHSVVKQSAHEWDVFTQHARHIWRDIVKQGTQGTKAKLWLDDYNDGASVYNTRDRYYA